MSKKKRGLSLDDKRDAILSVYHENKEPYNLKELENLASKKGVVIQTVKDVNQSLIDDGLVCTDKIGAANFFWSFPAKVYQDKLFQKENLSQNLQAATKRCDEIEGQIENAKLDRKSSDRPLKIKRLNELYAEEKEVDAVIEENKFNDPAEIGRIKNEIHSIVDCINRWTDNTFAVKKFLVKKANRSGKEVDKMLQINDNFDYVTSDEPLKKAAKR